MLRPCRQSISIWTEVGVLVGLEGSLLLTRHCMARLQALPENQRRTINVRGVVIAKRNRGIRTSFTLLNNITGGGNIERTFPLCACLSLHRLNFHCVALGSCTSWIKSVQLSCLQRWSSITVGSCGAGACRACWSLLRAAC